MTIICFEVHGTPIGKEEIRVNTKTKQAYKGEKTRCYFQQIQLIAKNYMQLKKLKKLEGPIDFRLDIILKEKETSKYIAPTQKPDSSNVLKTVEDALSKICYVDDKDIISHQIYKWFGRREKIVITIKPISCLGHDFYYRD
jgi:Holliday junction resolvase RusA-like endonuclease